MIDMDKLNARIRAQREPLGLNVRFIREDGTRDEWSFATAERAEAFKAKLRRAGLEILP